MIDFSNSHLTARLVQAAWGGLLLVSLASRLATAQFHFETWDTERGLAQNSILSILQTRNGYLWLAAGDGLVRFDGVRFTDFNIGNTRGIGSNHFERLYEDKAGNLWITTAETSVIRYRDGAFTSFNTGDTRDDIATAIWEDSQGRLVISTHNGLASFQDQKFVPITSPESTPCQSSFQSAGARAWCYDDAGLHVLKMDGSTALFTLAQGLPSTNVSFVYQDQSGTIWVATRDAGLARLKDGVFTRFAPTTQVSGNRAVELRQKKPALALLTPTEQRVLRLIADYKTSPEIADELCISPRTVERHRANICEKLELKGSHALLKFATAHKSQL